MSTRPALLLLALPLLALACGGPSPTRGLGRGGDTREPDAIEFRLAQFGSDQPISLRALRRPADGPPRAVLVTYFTTWCIPCMEMLPHLDRLDRELDGLAVLAVSLDQDPTAMLPPAVEYLDLQIPIALADPVHRSGDNPFGKVNAVPVAFLVDPEGRHVDTFVGITPTDYLRRRVAQLTEGTR